MNPLRDYLLDAIDFEKVRAFNGFKIFVAATNVHTGKIKVFKGTELTADHVMASATFCRRFSRPTVIDGEPYWDGGYMGNPALFPFFYGSDTPDIVIVQINPLERH